MNINIDLDDVANDLRDDPAGLGLLLRNIAEPMGHLACGISQSVARSGEAPAVCRGLRAVLMHLEAHDD